MKPWIKDAGITKRGALRAAAALPVALHLVAACKDDESLARLVLEEALFQRCRLPNLAPEFQAQYLKKNGVR